MYVVYIHDTSNQQRKTEMSKKGEGSQYQTCLQQDRQHC